MKTIFIEVTLTKESLVNEILAQKLARDVREGRINGGADGAVEAAAAAWREKVLEFKKLYVTLQNDGSEDDLSYIKLINYGEKVLTNNMRAYLPQRIVQFLTATHPTKHTDLSVPARRKRVQHDGATGRELAHHRARVGLRGDPRQVRREAHIEPARRGRPGRRRGVGGARGGGSGWRVDRGEAVDVVDASNDSDGRR